MVKKRSKSKKYVLRGGLIGLFVCLVLFVFYMFLYFPIIENGYRGVMSGWVLVIPLVTGHAFPLLSHFIVPYGFFCKLTKPECVNWVADKDLHCVPWTMEGVEGCCREKVMTPTSACDQMSERIGFWGLTIILFGIYFMIGAGIGLIKQKRR